MIINGFTIEKDYNGWIAYNDTKYFFNNNLDKLIEKL